MHCFVVGFFLLFVFLLFFFLLLSEFRKKNLSNKADLWVVNSTHFLFLQFSLKTKFQSPTNSVQTVNMWMKTSSASFAALCSLWPFVISCFGLQCEEDVLITHVKTHNTPEHYPIQAIYDSEPQRRFDLANPRTGRPAPLTGISPCVLTSCCGILTRGEKHFFLLLLWSWFLVFIFLPFLDSLLPCPILSLAFLLSFPQTSVLKEEI